jgi:hypothetical protein
MTNLTLHGILFSDFTIFTANTVILASKLTNKIPEVIPNIFRSTLGYLGLICLPFQFKDLEKNIRDLKYALLLKETLPILHTALKISLRALEIFFIGAGTLATFLTLTPFTATSSLIFASMAPFAIPGFFLPLSLDLIDAYEDRRLLKLLENQSTLNKVTEVVNRVLKNGEAPTDKIALQVLKQFSLLNLSQLTTDTISGEQIKSCLKTRLVVSKIDLTLKGVGQIGMAVGRLYPNSLSQAAFNFGISIAYNIKNYIELS